MQRYPSCKHCCLQETASLRLGAINSSSTVRLANLGSGQPLLLTYGQQPILFVNNSHTLVYGVNGSSSVSLTTNTQGGSVVNLAADVINLQAPVLGLAGNLSLSNSTLAQLQQQLSMSSSLTPPSGSVSPPVSPMLPPLPPSPLPVDPPPPTPSPPPLLSPPPPPSVPPPSPLLRPPPSPPTPPPRSPPPPHSPSPPPPTSPPPPPPPSPIVPPPAPPASATAFEAAENFSGILRGNRPLAFYGNNAESGPSTQVCCMQSCTIASIGTSRCKQSTCHSVINMYSPCYPWEVTVACHTQYVHVDKLL